MDHNFVISRSVIACTITSCSILLWTIISCSIIFWTIISCSIISWTISFHVVNFVDIVFFRPPGHHAEHNFSMGYSYFNNVAIAAKIAQNRWNIERQV